MDLKAIKLQLESFNYYVFLVSDTLIVGTDPEEPDCHGIAVFKAFCSVEIQANLITVEYGQANLSKEKQFSDEVKAVEFIKKMFPIPLW